MPSDFNRRINDQRLVLQGSKSDKNPVTKKTFTEVCSQKPSKTWCVLEATVKQFSLDRSLNSVAR